jgi:hypothetical protein
MAYWRSSRRFLWAEIIGFVGGIMDVCGVLWPGGVVVAGDEMHHRYFIFL